MEENKEQIVPSPSPTQTQPLNTIKKLPPFMALLKEALETLKHSLVSLIKLWLVTIGGILAVVAVVGIFVFLGTILAPAMGAFAILLIPGAFALIVFYVVSFIVLISTSQIAVIKILTSQTKLPIIKTMKESLPLVIPLAFTSFISQLLIAGGLVLLLIPGLVIAVLFAFVNFVVVTENLKGKDALRRSYQLVRPYFWKILLLTIAIQIPVTLLSQVLVRFLQDYPALYLLYLPFVLISGYYIQALNSTLYKNAKAITSTTTPIKMKWILIVAILGWIAFAVIIISVTATGIANPESLESLITPTPLAQ